MILLCGAISMSESCSQSCIRWSVTRGFLVSKATSGGGDRRLCCAWFLALSTHSSTAAVVQREAQVNHELLFNHAQQRSLFFSFFHSAVVNSLSCVVQAVTFLVIHQKHKKSLEEITNDLCPVLSVQQLYRIRYSLPVHVQLCICAHLMGITIEPLMPSSSV